MIPLQYVNAEELLWLFRVPDPSGLLEGLGFWLLFRSAIKRLIRHYGRGHFRFITFRFYVRARTLLGVHRISSPPPSADITIRTRPSEKDPVRLCKYPNA